MAVPIVGGMSVAAILLAGGSGSRVQGNVNKVYLPVGGRDLLAYPLQALAGSPLVEQLVMVVREEDRDRASELTERLSTPVRIVPGGATRHQSELAGLEALAEEIESRRVEWVAIHDGARPFLTFDLLERVLEAARRVGGAVPGLALDAPLYRSGKDGVVEALEPATLRKVQTPQAFAAGPLLAAYRAARLAGFEGVDTAETVERFSQLTVAVVPGDPRNIKVTFVEDFFQAEEWAPHWVEGRWKEG